MALKLRQKKLAELMVLEPELTNEQYAERIGISEWTVYNWKKSNEFTDYLHECCQQEFKSLEKMAIRKLKENCAKGNQKAIEYLLDYIGYKSSTKIDAEINGDIDINIDIEE